ncbi:MAG: hypothetical protein QOF48_925 [Verrucomicrobiota bacterium]|jgi:hypothetical protein
MKALRLLRYVALSAFAITVAIPVSAESFNSVYLSEFLADNQHSLQDDDRERSPWIELHNRGAVTVNLAGWFLTDTPTNLAKWRFPAISLLPEKYLLVFASGKDRVKDLAHLHTSFRLEARGSYLALVNPRTNVVSGFSAAAQLPDVSDGRVRGEPAIRGHFIRPTPGRPNAISGPGFAPEIAFSKPAGNFTTPFALQLSTGTTGALIRFTRDGSMPNAESPIWSGPLSITNTAHVRARPYQAGLLPGPPHSEVYLRLFTNTLDFTSTLPVVIMDILGKETAISSRGSFVHLSFHEPIGGKTSLTNPPTLTTRASYHVRGSTSAGMPQTGFAVQFLDEFNDEKHRAPLGLPPDSDWVLYAPNGFDPVMIHNPFVHELSRELGRYSPRTRFVEVFLVRTAGRVREAHYNGVYVLEEKIKIGPHRVDLDRLGPEDLKPPVVTRGYLLKFDRLGPGENGFSAGGPAMVYVEPKESILNLPQRAPQKEYLQSFFSDFHRALNGSNWKDPKNGYAAFLDVGAAIDFHVLEVLSGNVDAMVFSTYFQKPRGGRIICGPHWDFDRALGSTDGRDANPRQWDTGPFFSASWWPRLFSDPDFWQLWVDRWQDLRGKQFALAHLGALIDRLTDELREAQPREYKKWGLQARGGSYQGEINVMKSWLSNRIDFIDHQLVASAHLSREGGRVAPGDFVTLTASPNASIYFTMDGSDPRLSQGAISSNAFVYSAPIQLTTSVRVVARARDPGKHQSGGPPTSTPWSGPVTADFSVGR